MLRLPRIKIYAHLECTADEIETDLNLSLGVLGLVGIDQRGQEPGD